MGQRRKALGPPGGIVMQEPDGEAEVRPIRLGHPPGVRSRQGTAATVAEVDAVTARQRCMSPQAEQRSVR